ncbi:hypothetical protein [Microbacterium sp. C7(2022)]|uniref:hypothetical protein n=1 Tax=Microbacterium sp. C7(2022) TaxID=2992759 RepID=UPI00237C2F3C|nr:hypothetical protein [Microbacterium sp. C7(2022)]MDE0547412.1 hypothetical protein [Microbacterium sp. C7(2022)]
MSTDLSTLFAEQQTNVIDWHGPLYSLYDLPATAAGVHIQFVAAASGRPQGLRLRVRGGAFQFGDVTHTDLSLWCDTAPDRFTIPIRWRARGARSLRIWNAWRVGEVTQAWIGNAGMRVSEDEPGRLTLRCSDGEGPPDFDDLIAVVTLV